jgi:hypothetical protein
MASLGHRRLIWQAKHGNGGSTVSVTAANSASATVAVFDSKSTSAK